MAAPGLRRQPTIPLDSPCDEIGDRTILKAKSMLSRRSSNSTPLGSMTSSNSTPLGSMTSSNATPLGSMTLSTPLIKPSLSKTGTSRTSMSKTRSTASSSLTKIPTWALAKIASITKEQDDITTAAIALDSGSHIGQTGVLTEDDITPEMDVTVVDTSSTFSETGADVIDSLRTSLSSTSDLSKKLTRKQSSRTAYKQPDPPVQPEGLVEIAFSFDTTGSMSSALNEVKGRIKDIVHKLQSDVPGIRIAIFAHGDYFDKDKYVIKWIDFGATLPELHDFVNNCEDTHGGDGPECYELVLRRAHQVLSWTPGSKRSLVIIGDNIPHEPGYRYGDFTNDINWRDECTTLKEKGIRVYGVAVKSRPFAQNFYREIAQRTDGIMISLDKFDIIFELMMAICYREGGDELLSTYQEELKEKYGVNKFEKNLPFMLSGLRPGTTAGFTPLGAILSDGRFPTGPIPPSTSGPLDGIPTTTGTLLSPLPPGPFDHLPYPRPPNPIPSTPGRLGTATGPNASPFTFGFTPPSSTGLFGTVSTSKRVKTAKKATKPSSKTAAKTPIGRKVEEHGGLGLPTALGPIPLPFTSGPLINGLSSTTGSMISPFSSGPIGIPPTAGLFGTTPTSKRVKTAKKESKTSSKTAAKNSKGKKVKEPGRLGLPTVLSSFSSGLTGIPPTTGLFGTAPTSKQVKTAKRAAKTSSKTAAKTPKVRKVEEHGGLGLPTVFGPIPPTFTSGPLINGLSSTTGSMISPFSSRPIGIPPTTGLFGTTPTSKRVKAAKKAYKTSSKTAAKTPKGRKVKEPGRLGLSTVLGPTLPPFTSGPFSGVSATAGSMISPFSSKPIDIPPTTELCGTAATSKRVKTAKKAAKTSPKKEAKTPKSRKVEEPARIGLPTVTGPMASPFTSGPFSGLSTTTGSMISPFTSGPFSGLSTTTGSMISPFTGLPTPFTSRPFSGLSTTTGTMISPFSSGPICIPATAGLFGTTSTSKRVKTAKKAAKTSSKAAAKTSKGRKLEKPGGLGLPTVTGPMASSYTGTYGPFSGLSTTTGSMISPFTGLPIPITSRPFSGLSTTTGPMIWPFSSGNNGITPTITPPSIGYIPPSTTGLFGTIATGKPGKRANKAAKTGSKYGAKTGSKTAAKTGSKTAAKTGSKTAAKTGSKNVGKTGSKTSAKTGSKTVAKTGSKTAAKTGSKTAAKIPKGLKIEVKAGTFREKINDRQFKKTKPLDRLQWSNWKLAMSSVKLGKQSQWTKWLDAYITKQLFSKDLDKAAVYEFGVKLSCKSKMHVVGFKFVDKLPLTGSWCANLVGRKDLKERYKHIVARNMSVCIRRAIFLKRNKNFIEKVKTHLSKLNYAFGTTKTNSRALLVSVDGLMQYL